ncbi:MAG: hypothetical protein PHO46_10180 [Thermoguttaceae bacterium]|nr:hypothetical protein [Thermoguttaceae bacterium]
MATVYFTNNADSGDGSLRAALAAASPSDVVTYADGYFDGSDEIAISLSSNVSITKDVVLDARDKRIVLDGQFTSRCLWASADLQLRKVDLINGYSNSSYSGGLYVSRGAVTLDACRIHGCFCKFYGSALYALSGSVVLNDCLITGCCTETAQVMSASVRAKSGSSVAINRCTIVGDAQRALSAETDGLIVVADSIVQGVYNVSSAVSVTPSTCGFAAPCPDVIDSSTWNNALWQSWDFRLTPESPYLTGAETASAENADLLGNPRQVGGALGAFEGSWLVVTSGEEKMLAADVRVDRLELHDCAALSFVGQDRRLSVVEGAVVGSATIHAPEGAYVALPDVASADAAIVIGATLCEYGAGLTAFGASASSATEVALAWTASDPDRGVLLERRVDGAWTTLAFVETGAAYTTSASPGRSYYRAYDGDVFLYADIWSALGVQFRVASTWVPAETATQNWEVLVQNVTTTERVMPGQGITLLARIYDAFDEDAALLNDGENVVSVKYACYFNSNGLFEEANEPVPGHVDVDAGCGCVLESVQTSDAWTLDDVGYNFALTPDVRTAPLFEREGRYQIKVVVTLSEGNPVVFYVPIDVVDR